MSGYAEKALFRLGATTSLLMVLLMLSRPVVATVPVFSVHDTDRDGYLDRSEYSVFLSRLWEKRARRMGHHPLPPPMAFDEIDADADGRISEEELLRSLQKRLRHRRWRRGWGG